MKSISLIGLLFAAVTGLAGELPAAESQQLIYLADSGVVVLQLSILVDNERPKVRFERFVDGLLTTLDKNGDGVVTVDEARGKILTVREARQMQLVVAGETPVAEASPDVSPKDGKISRAELLAYFKRIGLLPSFVTFQARAAVDPETGANANGTIANGATDAPLFDRLDTNGDKKLSKEELANALDVLRKLDRDDDETISVAELMPLAAQPQPPNRRGMNNVVPAANPFVSLAGGESLPKLIRRVIDKYDSADAAKSGVPSLTTKNQKLSRMELGLPEAEFTKYDVDGDGQLDFAELRQFVSSAEADLELELNLSTGKVTVSGPRAADVQLTADGAAHLLSGPTQITVSVQPGGDVVDPEAFIRPLFTVVDADANGYLEKMEAPDYALFGAAFADLDADKNSKLDLDEIVDYLKPRLDAARSRVAVSIIEQGRTLFDILDSDRDGRLAHREIRSVGDKLVLWDNDGDGLLSEAEIPLQFRMVAARGSLPIPGMPQVNVAVMNPPGNISARTAGPVWFRKMDRNQDGEISRREFLGELDLFETLDLNGDGAIELNEAVKVRADK